MDDRKTIIDRVLEARDATVNRVQQGVQTPSVSATKERARAAGQRAQIAAPSLDRIEAAVNDLAKRMPEEKPAARPRATRAKPKTPSASS
jgi:hypothetical protein